MTVKPADWLWLRTAAMDHPGYLPGMPWTASAYAFERLLKDGLVTREEFTSYKSTKTFLRAVITARGRAALAANGAEMLARIEAAAPGESGEVPAITSKPGFDGRFQPSHP